MSQSSRCVLILLGLTFLGVFTHLLPHAFGFTTVGAISMLAAAYLPRSLALIPVVITVFVADATIGFYTATGMLFVYLAHLLATLAVIPGLRTVTSGAVSISAVTNAVAFYLVSNITPMVMGFYPMTAEGWTACYINGLPFLLKGVFANLVFAGAAFAAIWLVGVMRESRLAAAERY